MSHDDEGGGGGGGKMKFENSAEMKFCRKEEKEGNFRSRRKREKKLREGGKENVGRRRRRILFPS